MGIISFATDTAGQVGINPRRLKIMTTDNLATVTTAGYLTPEMLGGFNILPTDVIDMIYSYSSATNSGTYDVFLPAFSNGVITLSIDVDAGNVLLPVVSGDFAVFNGTSGQVKDSGSAPSSSSKPFVVMSPGSVTNGNIAKFSDVNGTLADGGVAAANVLTSAIASPDVSIDLVRFDITVGQAALAAGGSVTLQASSGTKQYKIVDLWINRGGVNFSGGGGDRLGQITDGTTVYSVIPAAEMQALTNERWGNTNLPFPASAAIDTSTVAGAALVFKYSGGTLDYTAGSVVISGLLQRVA